MSPTLAASAPARRARAVAVATGAVSVLLSLPAPARAQAVALAGSDVVRLQLPATGLVESYANAGYRLTVAGGVATVEVSLAPLHSRQGFVLPAPSADPVATLARAVAAGTTTRYQAVTQVLSWVARNIAYDLDRGAPQEAATVLARRSGYCTGIAHLSVAMLRSLGIAAREVPGFLVAPAGAALPVGFHRWVEVQYDDVGWVFSDPVLALHYVPATYVRLASEELLPEPEVVPGRLLSRQDERLAVDLLAEVPPRVTVRRNEVERRAAALQVTVGGGAGGFAVLEGAGVRRTRSLAGGESTFVGLEPGSYLLRVEVAGTSPRYKRIVLRDRVWGSVHLPLPAPGPAPQPTEPNPRPISKEEST